MRVCVKSLLTTSSFRSPHAAWQPAVSRLRVTGTAQESPGPAGRAVLLYKRDHRHHAVPGGKGTRCCDPCARTGTVSHGRGVVHRGQYRRRSAHLWCVPGFCRVIPWACHEQLNLGGPGLSPKTRPDAPLHTTPCGPPARPCPLSAGFFRVNDKVMLGKTKSGVPTVRLKVSGTTKGPPIPPSFLGFSLEVTRAWSLGSPSLQKVGMPRGQALWACSAAGGGL